MISGDTALYKKPSNIKDDMGGMGQNLDDRMLEIMQILPHISDDMDYKPDSVLDIGFGKGQIPFWFNYRGYRVTSIGIALDSYGADISSAKKAGIDVVEASVQEMPFRDNSYDIVVASHILEHISDMGKALMEIRRVLKPGGVFVMFIPPYIDKVCAGHVNTGWNIGQVIYVLLLNGFNVKRGHFLRLTHSICSVVKKSDEQLPPLRGDRGDIQILNDKGFFPFRIKNDLDGVADGFDTRGVLAVNWDSFDGICIERRSKSGIIMDLFIKILYKLLGSKLIAISVSIENVMHPRVINPKEI